MKKEEVKPPESNEAKLLKQLADLQAEKEALESKVQKIESKQAEVEDPMSGPGDMCEAYVISRGEAWQPKIIGETKDHMLIFETCPEGYQEKKVGDNTYFTKNGDLIPNCRSKFTKEYVRKYRKKDQSYPNFTYDEEPIKLCEKHAHILLGKTDFAT